MKLFLGVAVDLSAGCQSFTFLFQWLASKLEMIYMQIQKPKCCGREMTPAMETIKFLELNCEVCGDVVYLKKDRAARPQMLDD